MGILPVNATGLTHKDTPSRSDAGSCLLRHNIHCHPPAFNNLDSSLRIALDSGFVADVDGASRLCLIQSLIQLERQWAADSPFFKLQTSASSLPVVPLESLKLLNRIHNEGNKVHAVIHRDCSSTQGYVLKTIERSIGGWKYLYHELRLLLSIPPHPHIMPVPVALVSPTSGAYKGSVDDMAGDIYNIRRRIPICGFLMPYIQGTSLHEVLAYHPRYQTTTAASCYPCKDPVSRQLTKVKWCRQLAEALTHILRHGNGPNHPGFYSDLKPDNVLITTPGLDVLLLDFEQAGNRSRWRAPETVEHENFEVAKKKQCELCPTNTTYTYKSFAPRESTPEHWNGCEKHWTWSPINPVNLPNSPAVTTGHAYFRFHYCRWWEYKTLGICPDSGNTCEHCPTGGYNTRTVNEAQKSTPEHMNSCEIHWAQDLTNPAILHNYPGYDDKNYYSNPPFGYYKFFTVVTQEEKEKAMVFSLGRVWFDILIETAWRGDYDDGVEKEVEIEVPVQVVDLERRMALTDGLLRPKMQEVLEVICNWEEQLKVNITKVREDHKVATKREDLAN
jgi:hypothetical protein